MEIALRKCDFNADFAQFAFDGKVEIAPVAPGASTHFAAPDDQFHFDRVITEFAQKNTRRRILERVRAFARGGKERFARFFEIAAVSYANGKPKPDARVAIRPVRHCRLDEFRVWHDHRDVVITPDHGASGANLLDLTRHTRHFDTIADCNRSFGKDNKAAYKVAGDILKTESNADPDRAGKHRQGAKMNPRIIEHDEKADNEDDVAGNLSNRVLQRSVQSALLKEIVKEKVFRFRRKPEYDDEQGDKQKNLNDTELDRRQWRGPGNRDASGINRAYYEKHEHAQTQNRCRERGEVWINFCPAQKPVDRIALQDTRDDEPSRDQNRKRDHTQDRDVATEDMENGLAHEIQIHRANYERIRPICLMGI